MPEAKFCECRKCENYYSWIDVYNPDVTIHCCKWRKDPIEISGSNVTQRTILCALFVQSTSYFEDLK